MKIFLFPNSVKYLEKKTGDTFQLLHKITPLFQMRNDDHGKVIILETNNA